MRVPFPTTTTPGKLPGEGQGRLINCHPSKEGEAVYLRRSHGLRSFATLPTGPVRGMLSSGAMLYVCAGSKVCRVGPDGAIQTLYGEVAGSGPVTMAQTNAQAPQRVVVSQQFGAQRIGDESLHPLGVSSLSLPNSVARVNGYLIYTRADGRMFATNQNSLGIDELSFATAESDEDGLVRGVVNGGLFYAMGNRTIEVWQDVGALGFPLSRLGTVVQVGLISPFAVAGVQGEWAGPTIFVASDGSVRTISGVQTERISTPDVERMIGRADPEAFVASVHVHGGAMMWSLSSDQWTLEYEVGSGSWCERSSQAMPRWRCAITAQQWGKWIAADAVSGRLYTIDPDSADEAGEPLVFGADSAPMKDFPARAVVRSVSLDFTLGRGAEGASSSVLKQPVAMISWSHDGGANWSNAIHRSLEREGRYAGRVSVHRLGLTTHHGFRLRWRITDPVHVSFQGATIDVEGRRA